MGKILTIILSPCRKEKSFPDLLPVAPPEFQSRLKNFHFIPPAPQIGKIFTFCGRSFSPVRGVALAHWLRKMSLRM
jgi:hypothetical protein